jgi:hypothetical protein
MLRLISDKPLAFVGVQLVLTIGWTGWTALAGLGLAPAPAALVLDWLIRHTPGQAG